MNGAGPAGSALREQLAEGQRGEIGAAASVARDILEMPRLAGPVISALGDDDPAIVAHAAHALMQVSLDEPAIFDAHVGKLLDLLDSGAQWEIGEQLPKILVRCTLSDLQTRRLVKSLAGNLQNKSNIVAACALSGLAALAERGLIESRVLDAAIAGALKSPRKALAARARRLRGAMTNRS